MRFCPSAFSQFFSRDTEANFALFFVSNPIPDLEFFILIKGNLLLHFTLGFHIKFIINVLLKDDAS